MRDNRKCKLTHWKIFRLVEELADGAHLEGAGEVAVDVVVADALESQDREVAFGVAVFVELHGSTGDTCVRPVDECFHDLGTIAGNLVYNVVG